jgi:hypothetical protein
MKDLKDLNTQKIIHSYIDTKVNGEHIDADINIMSLLRYASAENKIFKIDKNKTKELCCFRTTIIDEHGKQQDAVMMTFIMSLKLEAMSTNSTSEYIMEFVRIIEKILYPIHKMRYLKDIEGSNKSVGILQIFKIDSNDILNI